MGSQELMLELASKCNLNCKMCAFKESFTGIEMTKEQIIKILNDIPVINKYSKYYKFNSIRLDGNTEPLVYENLDFVVKEGRKVGITHFNIVSNGVLLSKEKSDILLNLDIDAIDISMTGIIYEVYKNFQGYSLSKYNCERQIEQIISNVKCFIEQRNRIKKKTTLTMRYIVTEENGYHFIDYINFFRKIGVDAIMGMTLTTNILHSKCEALGEIVDRKSCDSPNHPVVCANGNILFSNCQYDIPVLGNINNDSFLNIMLSIMVPRNWTTNCHKYSEHGIIKNERKEQIPCHAEVITQLNSRPKSFLKYLRKRRSLAS